MANVKRWFARGYAQEDAREGKVPIGQHDPLDMRRPRWDGVVLVDQHELPSRNAGEKQHVN